MKKIFLAAILLVMGGATILFADMNNNTSKTDAKGHQLVSLWEEYNEAVKADRPLLELQVLEKIKAAAQEKRLAFDFYDAAKQYVTVQQSRNWKLRDSLRRNLAKEVADFDHPMVTYAWTKEYQSANTGALFEFVKQNKKGLSEECNEPFHRSLGIMRGVMWKFIQDDYEYTLWDIISNRYISPSNPASDPVYSALKEKVEGKYPQDPYLRYMVSGSFGLDNKRAAYEALDKELEGKAVGLFPRQGLLRMDFDKLIHDKDSKEEDFVALYERCKAFEKYRASFRDDEKTIADVCTEGKNLIETLTDKTLSVEFKDGKANVSMRNIDKATMVLSRVLDKKSEIRKWNLVNPKRSFYLYDTVSVDIPALEDADYIFEVSSGKDITAETTYAQYTISLAVRKESDGYKVYAADYKTGMPIPKGTLELYRNGKMVASDKVVFNGFTPISKSMAAEIAKKSSSSHYVSLVVKESQTLARRSRTTGVDDYYYYRVEKNRSKSSWRETANVYKDRGAYNPGDTVLFKAVAFKAGPYDAEVLREGETIRVVFRDSENKDLETKELKTNEFGSVAGEFAIPTGLRNGNFTIAFYHGNTFLDSDSFYVGEFVLPTFDMEFDPLDTLFFPGDMIPVKGRVKSYSGHPLTGATLNMEVTRWGTAVLDAPVEMAPDGSFESSFRAPSSGYYNISVRVVDSTGETLEFSNGVYVVDRVSIYISPENSTRATLYVNDDYRSASLFRTGEPSFKITVNNSDGRSVPGVQVDYVLKTLGGAEVDKGSVKSGDVVSFKPDFPSGTVYVLETEVNIKTTDGSVINNKEKKAFLLIPEGGKSLADSVDRLFIPGDGRILEGDAIKVTLGTSSAPLWAVATLYGDALEVLETRMVYLGGKAGESSSLSELTFDYKEHYPDAVRLVLFWFRDGDRCTLEQEYTRLSPRENLSLEFTSFTDKVFPDREYTFKVHAAPGMEMLAAAFDKSLDAIRPNPWHKHVNGIYSVPSPWTSSTCGVVGQTYGYDRMRYEDGAVLGATSGARIMKSKAAYNTALVEESVAMAPMERRADSEEMAMDDMAQPMASSAAGAASQEEADKVNVREVFSTALTFQPFLRSDDSGDVSFSFRTSDKLSTYYVALYAHDKEMNNATLRKEMVVSVPVRVSVIEPQVLREGDNYILSASVTSTSDNEIPGTLFLYEYAGKEYKGVEPVSVQRTVLKVPAHGEDHFTFAVKVPSGISDMGFRLVFVSKEFSDGMFVTVPVEKSSQTITEAHSAVLLAGKDRDALIGKLRSRFVNVKGSEAELKEVTILDLVKEFIPDKVEPKNNDIFSLSEAWYVDRISAMLNGGSIAEGGEELLNKIMECRNADGGFGWFEGMKSSPVVTAVILERFAKAAAKGAKVPDLKSSVKYLDDIQFSTVLPSWCGYISDPQYMYVRSMYANVDFDPSPTGGAKSLRERKTSFEKDAKDYLVPSKKDGRGLKGRILDKARRVMTLENLLETSEGVTLAKRWGISIGTKAKMANSIEGDLASLIEYAVEHTDGGWYYPNAVMPWRGLLESEAYAHSMLADLMSRHLADGPKEGVIADGIRLWLMLQKETQKWDADPAFVDAVNTILSGSEALLDTKILSLSATFTKPYSTLKAAGNGFRISRKFYKMKTEKVEYTDGYPNEADYVKNMVPLNPGEVLHVGDRIIARYSVWSQENRSFVKITVPREAALKPVNQISCHYGWRFSPIRYAAGWSFTPQGYRNVKAGVTDYYFDTYPEEETIISEEFFVTQEGAFTAPVIEVESLYAPHYRANGAYTGTLSVVR